MRAGARTNLWLAVLVAVLLVAGIETLRHQYEAEEDSRVPLLALQAVRELHIERRQRNTVHLRRNGDWRMLAPLSLPADQLRVQRLLDELHFRHSERVADARADAELYGLQEAAVRIRVRTDTTTHEVMYGDLHPITQQRYIAIDGDIYLAEGELYPALLAQDLFMAEHYLLPRGFRAAVLEYRGQRIPLSVAEGGPSRLAWDNARALNVEAGAASGEPLVIEAADGRRIELQLLPDTVNLQLARPELGIHYQFQSSLRRELLPDDDDAGAAGG